MRRCGSTNDILNVCVTGRRHIVPESLPRVESSARLLFRALLDAYDGAVSFRSGGAIGADTLALRLFLEEKSARADRALRAILTSPFPLERYRQDFSNPSDLASFERLVAACDQIEIVSDVLPDQSDYLAPYARLGDFLCDKADVLFAFWNGNVSEIKRGGTVDVALKKLARRDGSVVCCVSTPELKRKKNPDGTKVYIAEPTDRAGDVAILRGEDDLPITFVEPKVGAAQLRDLLRATRSKLEEVGR